MPSNTETQEAGIPECHDDRGHAWVVGRPQWIEEPDCEPGDDCDECLRTPDNVAYITRQCRRCGFHDTSDPREAPKA